MCAADTTDPTNGTVWRIGRAFYVRVRGLRRVSYRSVMTAMALEPGSGVILRLARIATRLYRSSVTDNVNRPHTA